VIDLGELEDYPSNKLPGFTEALLGVIPTLNEHECSYREPGGFIKRLEEGTWLGHIMEHVAIELQCLVGSNVSFGKARGVPGHEGVYNVIFEYENHEKVGIEAGYLAMNLLNKIIAKEPEEQLLIFYQKELENLAEIAAEWAFGPSTAAIINAAEERDIPWLRLSLHISSSLVQLGWGKFQRRIWATTSSNTSQIAVDIAQDKELTAQLLYDVGVPVPKGGVCRTLEEARHEIGRIGYPVVTKPLDASHGRGVTLNIRNDEDLQKGIDAAQYYSKAFVIEQFMTGEDYRLLFVDNEFVAAAHRIPAHVVGDGKHTVEELVEIANQDPRRGVGHEKALTRIQIHESTDKILLEQGLSLQSIPNTEKKVFLEETANLSTGGTSIDVTDTVHASNIEIARRAANVVGLDIAGVDIICQDIAKPIGAVGNKGAIIEVNAGPGFRMHTSPTEGTPRDVGSHVIDMLFPRGTPSRVPLIAVTGTNGKTTVARMIAHIQKMRGKKVGLTTTDGIYIDGNLLLEGDMTGPWSARLVLREPAIDFACLEVARGGILREGLGFDKSNVGIITNIAADHLGLRGINTVEDMADVKGLIFEVIRREGYGIVNAQDNLVYDLRRRIDGEIILVSMDPDLDSVRNHLEDGGIAVVLTQKQMISILEGPRKQTPVIRADQIPATMAGLAAFNIQNALFATAACYAVGTKVQNIRQGLATFHSSHFQTPGRLNVFEFRGARIISDYAHNPAAITALCNLVKKVGQNRRLICIFGMPGDRPDDLIREAAQIAGETFNEIIIKEDVNKRGREEGEVASLIREELTSAGFPPDRISMTLNELEAVQKGLESLKTEDLLVITVDDIKGVHDLLLDQKARYAEVIGP
ncbi:MAG: cyanophycin synthetase, partial [Candidatus Hodarchaeota archaeon]